MLDLVRVAGSARKSRLFACACCRRIWDLITTPCSRAAVEVAEKFADGLASEHERAAAFAAAIREANGWANCCGFLDAAYGGGAFAAAFAVADARTVEGAGDAVVIAEVNFPDFMQTPVLIAAFFASTAASAAAAAWVQANQEGNLEEEHQREWEATVLAAGAARSAAIGVSAVTAETDAYEVERKVQAVVEEAQCDLLRDIFGNPFRSVRAHSWWLTPTVVALARGIYEDRAFDRLPILSDALQDAGCVDEEILAHCRRLGPHVSGCWVVDAMLSNE
jgi:hypothetical protein